MLLFNSYQKNLTTLSLGLAVYLVSYSAAYADWHLVGNSENVDVYIDRVEKIDDTSIKFWSLYTYKEKDSKGAASSKEKTLGNCKDLSSSVTYLVTYSQRMGLGDVVDSKEVTLPSFTPVVPDSIGETSLVTACLKAQILSPAIEVALKSFTEKIAKKSLSETADKPTESTLKASDLPTAAPKIDQITVPTISAADSSEGKFKVSVKSIQANVRELPDIASKVLGTVNSGTILIALNFSGNYYQVVTSVGKGFIHKSTVELVPLDKQETTKEGTAI
ncbi:MAG: SH3 domain-containing protein [Thiothrix sp.]|nr:MAG: SH3 domain-containing protein [Thiothrix sp.]